MCVYICIYTYVGVRYNAEKFQVGKYYTTPIFRFRMKCHLCENKFEIETDPKVGLYCKPTFYKLRRPTFCILDPHLVY